MIDLPAISPRAAEAATSLAARLPAPLEVAGLRLSAALVVGDAPAVPDAWAPVQARLGDGSAVLHLDPALLPRSATALLPELQAVGVPEDLRAILRDVLLTELTALLVQLGGERPVWTEADAAPRPHCIALRQAQGGGLAATVALDDAGLDWLAGRMAALPPYRAALDVLPVMLGLRLDAFAMTRPELAALEPGDVVLLDRDPFTGEGSLAVVAAASGGPGWRAALAGGCLTLLSTLDATMDNPEETAPAALDDLPLEVICEVGRITLTLAQLQEMAPGQVLDLGMDATASVSLRVNGHALAVGELVRIAGRVGIRLTEVKAPRQ